MDGWRGSGEFLGGRCFWVWDGLIVHDPGIENIMQVLVGPVASGDIRRILKPVGGG
jgi:hypothetical protein